MRTLRLLLTVVVIAGLAPGTFLRTHTGLRSDPADISIMPVDVGPPSSGPLRLTGSWQISSAHGWCGGFSALVPTGPDALIAGTDRGFLLDIDLGGAAPQAVPGSFRFVGKRISGRKEVLDLESLARDPDSGALWAAFEKYNLIERFDPDGSGRHARPPAMKSWSQNSGPETMTRLNDGRFLVIAEAARRGGPSGHPALLFAEDPVGGGTPLSFRLALDEDYDPVDATQLPDGRVLILLRHVDYTIPSKFSAIALADPALIRAGKPWPSAIIQHLPAPALAENFEGIAFIADRANPQSGAVWLIADDNFSAFQRSLLLRFAWQG